MYALDEYRSNMAAWEYSIELGMQKGMEKGMQKGMQVERYKNAKALKAIDIPLEKISEALGLSIEEIEKL